ncbi:MAG: glucose-6-phosphate isomerase [Calditrichaeota bacterium]|nr:glucose-6-phosphate isomerase [Calditrichota bacterium]
MININYLQDSDFKSADFVDLQRRFDSIRTSGDVGFFDLPDQETEVQEIRSYLQTIDQSIDTLLLIGIGGSSLGCITIYDALIKANNKRKFYCLDNVDSDRLHLIMAKCNPHKTLVNVVSKSGGTPETMSNFMIVYTQFRQVLGDQVNKHFVFTTDPKKGTLNKIAAAENINTFSIPETVGGRFSILSPVGLLLTEFMGYKSEDLLRGAADLREELNEAKNSMSQYALTLYIENMKAGKRNSVLMPYSSQLKSLSDWYCQLWAESLGKEKNLDNQIVNSGQTPISSLGANDQHSTVQLFMEGPNDKYFTFIQVDQSENLVEISNPFPDIKEFNLYDGQQLHTVLNSELKATAFALKKNKRSVAIISIPVLNEYYLGQLFFFFQVATVYSSILYHINCFDQPGVEAGKLATKALLGDQTLLQLKREIEEIFNK